MTRRNVLLIVVDQWRGDMLPCLGADFLKLPNIERLCREGVTFRNHYTQAAPCGPARASLLTGLYQMNHRAVQNTIPLDARHDNLGKMLRRIGYDPALVGYTTTTPDPRATTSDDPRFKVLGDVMEGFRPVGAFEPYMEAYFAWLLANGVDVPAQRADIWLPKEGAPGPTTAAARVPAEFSDTAWFTERALTYLRGRGSNPWFLHLGYYRPHPPFVAPHPFNRLYDPAAMPAPVRAASPQEEAQQHPLLDFYVNDIQQSSFFHGGSGLGSAMTDAEVRQMRAAYCGLMSEIDHHLGRVFAYLQESGQWDDTLIVLTCDHGEQLGDHHLLGKVGYFDQSFHIPMIVRDPRPQAATTRGSIVNHFTETIDTLPTILDWLDAEIPPQVDGCSLLPFVVDGVPPGDWRTEVHYEYDFRDVYYSKAESALGLHMDRASLAVVQDERYKYVHFAALPPLFFDLRQDPGQFMNRAEDPGYASLVRTYSQKMLDWRLSFAERTLTGYRASPEGLQSRRG
ncbi:phosphoric/sulfuric ester hydrolase PehA [Reyranella sp. CPCC 100927]|uniref:phosphoric/sulfuric ester hydrolase PehA n=1 Tax=Reyranella sp. CPCC 100927 TaxID=2599616 RepID=UPI0011B3FC8F|nr:phosphoric/sulfuric ester hydrolase PehA [Reyranella sp. CPCC 100927]TWS98270.1 alkaline phosphatase family protein [Reyranella sp. CPCC 100927]